MRNKRLLVFIGVLSLALLLAACGGDNDDENNVTPTEADSSSAVVPTDEPTEVAVVDDSTPEMTPEVTMEQMAEGTDEAEMTAEATEDMSMTDEMTPEATMDMEATAEMTMETEMTAEATEDMSMMDEMTPEATMDMEATAEMTMEPEMTAEATSEADMEPSFTIEVTGASDVTFTEADGSFEYDYEEPANSSGTDNTPMLNSGIYTFTFTYTDADDVENIIFVTFSDNLQEGTYMTPDELSTPEATGDEMIPLIVGSVNIGEDIAYTTVLDGTITLDQFADELASGSFEFHLANTDNLDDTVTLTGEFHNLAVQTNPADAANAPANNG